MSPSVVRVLLLADTHLGFDFPLRPRVERRRRGPDFFANTERALLPARQGRVDLVVHGGDLLYRSKVPPGLVEKALEPLLRVAEEGVPVVLVPGNHERSAIPYPMFGAHANLHILDRPRTVILNLAGLEVAVGGFPCEREKIRDRFTGLVEATGILRADAHIRLLCMHQTVEGATVGPSEYTFRYGRDIIRGRDIPQGVAAVLAGHIHRTQVLTRDLAGYAFNAPVFYPGAIERTSFAERREDKGTITLEVEADGSGSGRVLRHSFHQLPARALVDLEIEVTGLDAATLTGLLKSRLAGLDPDAVVRISLTGIISDEARSAISAAAVRELAPSTMTVETRRPRQFGSDGEGLRSKSVKPR